MEDHLACVCDKFKDITLLASDPIMNKLVRSGALVWLILIVIVMTMFTFWHRKCTKTKSLTHFSASVCNVVDNQLDEPSYDEQGDDNINFIFWPHKCMKNRYQ